MRIYTDYLNDIIESCKLIKEFTKDMNFEKFLQDLKTQYATVRHYL
jgi:uncharacterized protein with HEPN domain